MLRCATNATPQGFVLLSTLLLMQIILLLSWHAIENALIEMRLANRYQIQQRLFQEAETMLIQLEKQLINHPTRCYIPITLTQQLLLTPANQWPCHTETTSIKYFYAFEFLTHDSCALINQKYTANYHRVTLLAVSKESVQKIMLQSTDVTPDNALPTCLHPHPINLGRQSWYPY